MINDMTVICNYNCFILVANLLHKKHLELLKAYTELHLLSNHFAVISKKFFDFLISFFWTDSSRRVNSLVIAGLNASANA